MAIGAVGPLARGIAGTVQMVKADKLRKKYPFPEYSIPNSQVESLDTARNLAYDPRLPGQSFIEQGIDRSLATGIRGIRETGMSGAERLSGINAGIGSQMDAYTNLAAQMAANANANYGNLQDSLSKMAGYEDKKWQLNKQQPYLDAMEAANRLSDAGQQNIMNAVGDLSSVAASGLVTGGAKTPTVASAGAPAGGVVGAPTYEQFTDMQLTPLNSRAAYDPKKRLEEIAAMQLAARGVR